MIKKQDWETAVLQFEAMIVNDTLTHEISNIQFEDKINSYKKTIEFCKKKIAEFTDDKTEDKMPDGLKETLKEVVK